MTSPIPIILFAYTRSDYLNQTLDCLKNNKVPLIYAFSDGPRTPDKESAVAKVRDMLRSINWCKVILCERETNLGLGQSILAGITEVLNKHSAAIIFEDDLICVPGTYEYLCASLERYQDDTRVMSVTGWTHPLVTPNNINSLPYFDGRGECWVWGTWARAWHGMEMDAKSLMDKCEAQGIDIYRYGADLVEMANTELDRNIWAVRLLYLHILNRGLCLRPPWSMVEHIGVGDESTNVHTDSWLTNPSFPRPRPQIPEQWPEPVEHPDCPFLWQQMFGSRPTSSTYLCRLVYRIASKALRLVSLK